MHRLRLEKSRGRSKKTLGILFQFQRRGKQTLTPRQRTGLFFLLLMTSTYPRGSRVRQRSSSSSTQVCQRVDVDQNKLWLEKKNSIFAYIF